ncbi:MAG: RHS repeat-associated core domain-containing protein [Paludibacteraceae bacterium]|nr:RHS repeat-associated core domain-containing protein [Paludibacteraceae bacterium]
MPGGWLLSRSTSYIPYGEVFVEESSAGWQSPYYFNSKELDEETGLYYYGARYLNPTEARWLSVDPMFEKYVGESPYNFCANNPLRYKDVDGQAHYVTDENGITFMYENNHFF